MILDSLRNTVFVGARRTWVGGVERLHLRFRDLHDGRETTLTIEADKARALGLRVSPSRSSRSRALSFKI